MQSCLCVRHVTFQHKNEHYSDIYAPVEREAVGPVH